MMSPAELAEANLGLVYHMAKKGWASQYPLEDLVSVGNEALVRASLRFDPSRGIRFSTVACRYVLNAFRQYASAEKGWHHKHIEALRDDERNGWHSAPEPGIERVDDSLTAAAVLHAIDRLSPRRREIVTALYVEGRSVLEYASERGVSKSGVYKTRDRALRQLREAVGA